MPTSPPDSVPAAASSRWRRFLLPAFNRPFLIRLLVTAVIAWLFFGYICIPALINGDSMYPTYKNRAFLFCWRPRYWFASRIAATWSCYNRACKVMLLKRIIALPGDTVAFQQGIFLLNGEEPNVPWARTSACDWELAPRTVQPGHVYVVGDNRAMPIDQHEFGEIAISRIAGAPVW